MPRHCDTDMGNAWPVPKYIGEAKSTVNLPVSLDIISFQALVWPVVWWILCIRLRLGYPHTLDIKYPGKVCRGRMNHYKTLIIIF